MIVSALILAVAITKLVELVGEPIVEWIGCDRRFLLLAAILLGMYLAYLGQIDVFDQVGVHLGPIVGRLLTGIFMGGGGSVFYDLLDGWTGISAYFAGGADGFGG